MRFVELSHRYFVNRCSIPDNSNISAEEFGEKIIASFRETEPDFFYIIYHITRGSTEDASRAYVDDQPDGSRGSALLAAPAELGKHAREPISTQTRSHLPAINEYGLDEAKISFFRIPNELIEKLFIAKINPCVFGINPNNSNTREIKVLDGIPEYVKIISEQISFCA